MHDPAHCHEKRRPSPSAAHSRGRETQLPEKCSAFNLISTRAAWFTGGTPLLTRSLACVCAGVLFFSRIPPFLKPNTLRTLLSGMGTEVLRIYLAPESTEQRQGRVRAGGNKKKNYSEGWVEFEDKRRAKRIASTLNNTPMGGGNRSFYAHDLWNVKYLHKFKWHHLTEKMAYEQRVRSPCSQHLSSLTPHTITLLSDT